MESTIEEVIEMSISSFTVNDELLSLARAGNAEALFKLGLQAFSENRLGYAEAFFRSAAKCGYAKAREYLELIKLRVDGLKKRNKEY